MPAAKFNIVRSSDREMVSALQAMQVAGVGDLTCDRFVFAFLAEGQIKIAGDEIASDEQLKGLTAESVRVFRNIKIGTPLGTISIQRHQDGNVEADNPEPFDTVTVNYPPQANPQNKPAPEKFARLVAFAQKHLGKFSVNALTDYLGEDVRRHFSARDTALAKLEELVARLTREIEETRKRRDAELDAKDQRLEKKYLTKEKELEAKIKEREEELANVKNKLDEREESLNLQSAKAERRKIREEVKETLNEWSENFEITTSTKRLRLIIHLLCIILLGLFGTAAGIYLYQSIQLSDTAQFVTMSIKQGVFAALFVATGIFYARWNTHWFQRRANEEFRLKRMKLDFDRANWFVELAFQWQEDFKDQPIPPEFIERLTNRLFVSENDESIPQHPYETLGTALLGASAKVKVGPTGAEMEFDRKGIRQLKKDSD